MNAPRPVVEQINLQKQQLLRQIQQLQKQLQKQEKKQQKQSSIKLPTSVKKQQKPTKSSLSPRDLSTITKSNYKQTKPAISATWKSLFSVDPYLYQNKTNSYIVSKNKEDYKSELKAESNDTQLQMDYLTQKFLQRYRDD